MEIMIVYLEDGTSVGVLKDGRVIVMNGHEVLDEGYRIESVSIRFTDAGTVPWFIFFDRSLKGNIGNLIVYKGKPVAYLNIINHLESDRIASSPIVNIKAVVAK